VKINSLAEMIFSITCNQHNIQWCTRRWEIRNTSQKRDASQYFDPKVPNPRRR